MKWHTHEHTRTHTIQWLINNYMSRSRPIPDKRRKCWHHYRHRSFTATVTTTTTILKNFPCVRAYVHACACPRMFFFRSDSHTLSRESVQNLKILFYRIENYLGHKRHVTLNARKKNIFFFLPVFKVKPVSLYITWMGFLCVCVSARVPVSIVRLTTVI